ncbi:hypothetical protein [Candidatus Aalborgicola defluviihabitans]|uniref:hypothetical protein n=1 Tax=Candidatus Aalborgicola defluviihabitans TaxID=3386187 RepID=UPI001D349F24|nr:hypothetical protein [Burkholderiales bacterium]MBK7312614.1 hypothetical protein [Burkholderiales bacterium]
MAYPGQAMYGRTTVAWAGAGTPKLWLASRLEVSRSEDVADMALARAVTPLLSWLVDVN